MSDGLVDPGGQYGRSQGASHKAVAVEHPDCSFVTEWRGWMLVGIWSHYKTTPDPTGDTVVGNDTAQECLDFVWNRSWGPGNISKAIMLGNQLIRDSGSIEKASTRLNAARKATHGITLRDS